MGSQAIPWLYRQVAPTSLHTTFVVCFCFFLPLISMVSPTILLLSPYGGNLFHMLFLLRCYQLSFGSIAHDIPMLSG